MSGSIVFEDGTEPQGNLRGKCKNRNLLCIENGSTQAFVFPEGDIATQTWTMLSISSQQSIQRYMQIP